MSNLKFPKLLNIWQAFYNSLGWKHKVLLSYGNHLVSWWPRARFQGQTKVATLKSVYISLIIGPRGYGYEANL